MCDLSSFSSFRLSNEKRISSYINNIHEGDTDQVQDSRYKVNENLNAL